MKTVNIAIALLITGTQMSWGALPRRIPCAKSGRIFDSRLRKHIRKRQGHRNGVPHRARTPPRIEPQNDH